MQSEVTVYRAIANIVYAVFMVFHFIFMHVCIIAVIPQDANPLWAIPFALAYALFIGITLGICYYYVLPEKSKIYWHD